MATGAFIVARASRGALKHTLRKPSGTATQAATRHAAEYRQRARELIDQAWHVPGEGDRRHMLDLAAIYERTADALAPAPGIGEAGTVFTRRE